jgi:hypothetical protein
VAPDGSGPCSLAEADPGITRSEGERVLRRYLGAAGLSQPLTNRRIGPWEPDFLWPAERVIVELGSWEFHRHRSAFERDRRKDGHRRPKAGGRCATWAIR